MFDFKGRAKWDAWNKNKGNPHQSSTGMADSDSTRSSVGMSKEDAQKEYISLVEKLSVNYA